MIMAEMSLFNDFAVDWLTYKKEAIEGNDYSFYRYFLKETYGVFIGLYSELESPEALSLVDEVLKTVACEIRGISIKYKDKDGERSQRNEG